MRLRSLALLAASAVVLIFVEGCASSENIAPAVTPAMVSASRGASAETLNEGRRIFAGPCTTCHAPDPVSKYSLTEWHAAVDEMAPRTKLNAERRAALLAYIAAAKATDVVSSSR